jgi:hypothetical protein
MRRAEVGVGVGVGVVLAGATLAALATHARAEASRFVPPLERPTPVGVGEIVLRGQLRSALDGSTFDAITQSDRYPTLAGVPAPHTGGLFDPEAGGLRVIEQDPARHVYRLAATGALGRACREGGVASPCLAPRLAVLAHERLATADDLEATLSGSIEAEELPAPARPRSPVASGQASVLGWGVALASCLGTAAWLRGRRRARRAHAIRQVRVAAAQARRALRGQPTFARARDHIQALTARAEALEHTRRACAAQLGRLDARRLETQRATWSASSAPDAAAALAALVAETNETRQLAADREAASAGLTRISSSLRTLALRARADRGMRAIAAKDDPVEVLLGELALRDDAAREAEDAVVAPPQPHPRPGE